jgi:hypothetical protein
MTMLEVACLFPEQLRWYKPNRRRSQVRNPINHAADQPLAAPPHMFSGSIPQLEAVRRD